MFDVCVVGSANLDLIASVVRLPGPGETVLATGLAEHPGGKGLNQAVGAARAGGARVAFVGALGDDPAGATLRAVLHAEGIDTAALVVLELPSGRALIGVDEHSENLIIVAPGANAAVHVEQLPPSTVVLTQLEIPLDAVVAALRAGRDSGAINVLNPAPAAALDGELLGLCDVIVPNAHEAALLGGADRLLAGGAAAVVVTLGADGVEIHRPGGVVRQPAFAVTALDSTGAGDTFCGALAARLACGDDLPQAVRYGAAAAAISTTRRGAATSVPTPDEVLALLSAAG